MSSLECFIHVLFSECVIVSQMWSGDFHVVHMRYMHADATQSSHIQFMFEVGTSNNY